MKKILIILNAGHIPQHVISNAIHIAQKTSSSIYAVFINDLKTTTEFNYPFPNDLTLTGTRMSKSTAHKENKRLIESELQVFKDECELAGLEYLFEIDETVSIKHLLQISAYADIILADAGANSDEYNLKDILVNAHCPVLLISKEIKAFNSIVLCYDGSFSSTYAIKMFSYLFPEWSALPTTILHVSSSARNQIPHEYHFQSWASKHFQNLEKIILDGSVQEQVVNYIHSNSDHKLVVMGSFGENTLSRIFHRSLSNAVLSRTHASLFITHE